LFLFETNLPSILALATYQFLEDDRYQARKLAPPFYAAGERRKPASYLVYDASSLRMVMAAQ